VKAPLNWSVSMFVVSFTTGLTFKSGGTGGENGPLIRLGTLIPFTLDPTFLNPTFPTDTPFPISLPPIRAWTVTFLLFNWSFSCRRATPSFPVNPRLHRMARLVPSQAIPFFPSPFFYWPRGSILPLSSSRPVAPPLFQAERAQLLSRVPEDVPPPGRSSLSSRKRGPLYRMTRLVPSRPIPFFLSPFFCWRCSPSRIHFFKGFFFSFLPLTTSRSVALPLTRTMRGRLLSRVSEDVPG